MAWRSLLSQQDAVWLLLFAALAVLSPRRSAAEIYLLAGLAFAQICGSRAAVLQTMRGRAILIAAKLLLGFLLIGLTGGILSSYSLILLLPVVSAATSMGPLGVTAVTVAACAAELLFIPMALRLGYRLEADLLRDIALRTLFLPISAFLTYTLARAGRDETLRAQQTARSLAEANERLSQAEQSARRSDRLAALGQMTAGLAHELRNPIGTIKASAEMLAERLRPDDATSAELASFVSTEVDRTNTLITRFLDFAKPVPIRTSPCEIHSVIDRAIGNLQVEHPAEPLPIHRNYDPAVRPFPADPELLERVFFNLILNATQASPPGALVTIRTRALPDCCEISVWDQGPGVPAALKERIFDPFFTTRPAGTGLGLAICARIVAEHGGRIQVEGEPGHGAVFLVLLPWQVPDFPGTGA